MFWPRGNGETYRRSKAIGSVRREISWHDIPGEPVAKSYRTRRFTRDYRTWETYDCRMINSCRLVVTFNKAKITVSCKEVSGSGLRPAATFVYPDIPRIRFCPRNAADARVSITLILQIITPDCAPGNGISLSLTFLIQSESLFCFSY